MDHPVEDTHASIDELQMRILRQIPPWRKIELVFELSDTVSTLALLGITHRFPGIGEQELRRRYADLALGNKLAKKVYGPMQKD